MWSDRRLLELFEIEHPIVLAPMAGFGTVELAAAVADSGGLGSIGCATMNPQLAVETIARLRRLTDSGLRNRQDLSNSGKSPWPSTLR